MCMSESPTALLPWPRQMSPRASPAERAYPSLSAAMAFAEVATATVAGGLASLVDPGRLPISSSIISTVNLLGTAS